MVVHICIASYTIFNYICVELIMRRCKKCSNHYSVRAYPPWSKGGKVNCTRLSQRQPLYMPSLTWIQKYMFGDWLFVAINGCVMESTRHFVSI